MDTEQMIDTRRGRIHVESVEARGLLTPQKPGSSIPYDFSLNPYVGCAFGCSYCYVRAMQYGEDADEKSASWGRWVTIKANAVELLDRSLRRVYGKRVYLGSATDPYQPIERRLGLPRALLERLAMGYPARLHVQTRSPLAVRDIDVFQRFGEELSIGVSIPTDDDSVRKTFEPAAPAIAQRVAAVHALVRAGLRVTVAFAPLLPCNPERLVGLVRCASKGYWVDFMNYHAADPAMQARFRTHGQEPWGEADRKAMVARLAAVWDRSA